MDHKLVDIASKTTALSTTHWETILCSLEGKAFHRRERREKGS